jgi:hypothetical protein
MCTTSIRKHWFCLIGLIAAFALGLGAAQLHWPEPGQWLAADPKSAGERDRALLHDLLVAGYGSGENAISSTTRPGTEYLKRVRELLSESERRSPWLRMRLIDELAKWGSLADAGLLLRISERTPERWLSRHAWEQAKRLAAHATD